MRFFTLCFDRRHAIRFPIFTPMSCHVMPCHGNSCQILMDSEKREIYDKLGPEAAASKHPFNENTMLIEVCMYVVRR